MRRRLNSRTLAAAVILAALWRPVLADVMITTKGQRVEDVRVRSFIGGDQDEEDSAYFELEKLSGGTATGEPVEFQEKDVQSIEFRDAEDLGKEPFGRVAHIEGVTGDVRNHVIIESATRTAEGLQFRVRAPGEKPGGKTMRAKAGQVVSIMFSPSMAGEGNTTPGSSSAANSTSAAGSLPGTRPIVFPWLAYSGFFLTCLLLISGAVMLSTRSKAAKP